MELLINPTSYDNAIDLIELGIHQINIGLREFSMRNNCILTFAQIKKIISNKKSTKIILLFNKIFFEQDIEDLEKMLVEVSKLDIDGIIFCDYAICQICFEKKLKVNLIYHPETLNVNYGQIPFFEKNGISEIVLARELNSLNIKDIAAHKGTIKIQIQVAGYSYMMQSRWPLLTNFKEAYKIKDEVHGKKLMLKEPTRKHQFLIIEDKDGTHIFTKYNLSLIDKLKELETMGVDTIRIDSFLHDAQWTLITAKYYMEVLKNQKKKTITESIIAFKKFDKLISAGFYEINRDNLIYLKDEQKLEWDNE